MNRQKGGTHCYCRGIYHGWSPKSRFITLDQRMLPFLLPDRRCTINARARQELITCTAIVFDESSQFEKWQTDGWMDGWTTNERGVLTTLKTDGLTLSHPYIATSMQWVHQKCFLPMINVRKAVVV